MTPKKKLLRAVIGEGYPYSNWWALVLYPYTNGPNLFRWEDIARSNFTPLDTRYPGFEGKKVRVIVEVIE